MHLFFNVYHVGRLAQCCVSVNVNLFPVGGPIVDFLMLYVCFS